MNVCGERKERILLNQVLVRAENCNIKLKRRASKGVSTFFFLLQSFADEQFWSKIKTMLYRFYSRSL